MIEYAWALCKVLMLTVLGVISLTGLCIILAAIVTFVAVIWYIEIRFRRAYRSEYHNLHNR